MIVNKSQNQFLNIINVDLRFSIFFYDQLYVALFCVTNVDDLHVLLFENANDKTKNVVYEKILFR